MSIRRPSRAEVEDALIEEYTTGMKQNPGWSRKKARENDWVDDPNNPEYIANERRERVRQSPWVVFKAADGYPAMTTPPIAEIVDVLVRAGLVDDA